MDWYLLLAEECLEVEVVLDVIAFALAATKHATAVVLHVLHQAIAVLSRVVTSLLLIDDDEEVPVVIGPGQSCHRQQGYPTAGGGPE